MRLTVGTKPNRNGNSRRVTFDTESKSYYRDYSADIYIDLHVTAGEVKALIEELKDGGYKEMIRLVKERYGYEEYYGSRKKWQVCYCDIQAKRRKAGAIHE